MMGKESKVKARMLGTRHVSVSGKQLRGQGFLEADQVQRDLLWSVQIVQESRDYGRSVGSWSFKL